jgi:hypothetical protein
MRNQGKLRLGYFPLPLAEGLVFLNPPYDWTIGETRSERTERVFMAHTTAG